MTIDHPLLSLCGREHLCHCCSSVILFDGMHTFLFHSSITRVNTFNYLVYSLTTGARSRRSPPSISYAAALERKITDEIQHNRQDIPQVVTQIAKQNPCNDLPSCSRAFGTTG